LGLTVTPILNPIIQHSAVGGGVSNMKLLDLEARSQRS
jgi:hypothetical protein